MSEVNCVQCGAPLPHDDDVWRNSYRCRVIQGIYDAGAAAERERIRQRAIRGNAWDKTLADLLDGAPYQQCVTDAAGNCTRWSHSHPDLLDGAP